MLLVAVAVFSLFAMNRLTLIPLFADQVLHVGAHGFGFLLGSMGLGALVGALTLAFIPKLGADPRRQLWMAMIWVAALLEFSISRVFVLSMAALFVAGYCQISFVATANSRIQTLTPDHLRGRVMSLYAQALIGVGPLGSTQAGEVNSENQGNRGAHRMKLFKRVVVGHSPALAGQGAHPRCWGDDPCS